MVSTSTFATNRSLTSLIRFVLRNARFIQKLIGLPNVWFFRFMRGIMGKVVENPYVAELLRFIFLGTIVETSRLVGQKVIDFAKHCKSLSS